MSPLCGTNSSLTKDVTFTTQSYFITVIFQRNTAGMNFKSKFNLTFLSFSEGKQHVLLLMLLMYLLFALHQENMSMKGIPLEPDFYIEKLGFVGIYLLFLFLLQNMDCGYSSEPPRCTHKLCFEQK